MLRCVMAPFVKAHCLTQAQQKAALSPAKKVHHSPDRTEWGATIVQETAMHFHVSKLSRLFDTVRTQKESTFSTAAKRPTRACNHALAHRTRIRGCEREVRLGQARASCSDACGEVARAADRLAARWPKILGGDGQPRRASLMRLAFFPTTDCSIRMSRA